MLFSNNRSTFLSFDQCCRDNASYNWIYYVISNNCLMIRHSALFYVKLEAGSFTTTPCYRTNTRSTYALYKIALMICLNLVDGLYKSNNLHRIPLVVFWEQFSVIKTVTISKRLNTLGLYLCNRRIQELTIIFDHMDMIIHHHHLPGDVYYWI